MRCPLRRLGRLLRGAGCLGLMAAAPLAAQTTQGVIAGRVFDSQTGQPLADAIVRYFNPATDDSGAAHTDAAGFYALPFLSPGTYRLRAEQDAEPDHVKYQAREIYALELYVAARLEVDFPLRPLSEVWESGIYNSVFLPDHSGILPFFGPDVETGRSAPLAGLTSKSSTLQSALSYVIDPQQLAELPLIARQVYSMIVMQPGVTAENATGRGLGLAVNGQRAASSNFLLDGVENNEYLITGPFSVAAPEAIQEYRVSTSNFSAQFGRAGGFVANAVSRAGGSSFHGLGYGYLNNEALNANSFRRNAGNLSRPPQKQAHLGFWAGGPIRREGLFFSSAFEQFRRRGRTDSNTFPLPIVQRFRECPAVPADSAFVNLLGRFPAPAFSPPRLAPQESPCNHLTARTEPTRPVSVDRSLALERLDYRSPGGAHRLKGRLALSRFSQPDLIYSPYEDFNAPLVRNTTGTAFSYIRALGPDIVNELRLGWRNGDLHYDRPHPEIPSLVVTERDSTLQVSLPGSAVRPHGVPDAFANRENNWEIGNSIILNRGRHVVTAGGGVFLRRFDSSLDYGHPLIFFDSLLNLAAGQPLIYQVAVRREPLLARSSRLQLPETGRSYRNNQFFGFVEDSVKMTARLGVNLGVRYESFGDVLSTNVQDGYLRPASGASIEERIAGGELVFENDRRRAAYRPDRNNWAGRLGISYDLLGTGRTVLRGAYGIFYDRPFDNLMLNAQNNNISLETFCISNNCRPAPLDYLRPASEVIQRFTPPPAPSQATVIRPPLELVWVDENLRTPYVQSWFAGVENHLSPSFLVEINHMGSAARKLVTNDYVNRQCSRPCAQGVPGRLNPELPNIMFRSNAGSSTYAGLGALARYRSSRAQFQLAYTYSHSIDNQSDPLVNTPFDIAAFTNPAGASAGPNIATFTRQFDSRTDRGSSDFDQRHNLVFYSIWELPGMAGEGLAQRLLGGWQIAQLASFRSGFPYTVFAASSPLPPSGGLLFRNRPNLRPGAKPELAPPIPVPGGLRILDRGAFEDPAPGQVGNLGRNSLAGPGFWNVDLSLAKSFALPQLGEAGRIQLRADVFNFFNHANLNNPNLFLGSRSFGNALYGPTQLEEFPAATPLSQAGRRVELQVKVYF